MSTSTVLILGARGRFGDAACRAFAAAGWRVLAQVRPGPRADAIEAPAGITPLALPLSDLDALAAAAAGADVVVHAVNPVYTRWPQEAMPALLQALALARRLGAQLMLPGNVYAYGRALPALVDEHTPLAPDTPHGHIRAAMEAAIAAETGLRGTVICAGDFFGHGRGSWLDRVVARDISRGRLVYPGPLDVPHTWAWLPDLARAFVAVAEARRADRTPGFERLHFAGHTTTGREFLQALEGAAASLGLQPSGGWHHGALPWGVIRAGGLVWPMWRTLARMRYLWWQPHALDGRRLAARAMLPPAPPLEMALRDALQRLGHAAPASASTSAPAAPPVTGAAR